MKANDLDQYLERFEALNKSSTKHWAAAMQKMLGETVTMGDIRQVRPRAYFNASMLPSQDPFVFTDRVCGRLQGNSLFCARFETS